MLHSAYLSSVHHVSGTVSDINCYIINNNVRVHSRTKFSKMLELARKKDTV